MPSKIIKIKALDGHTLDGYLAMPTGTARAGLLVLQEIFGVTAHMRQVTDEFASHGFLALAPALFDRLRPGTELPYTRIDEGRTLMQQLAIDDVARDLAAAVAAPHPAAAQREGRRRGLLLGRCHRRPGGLPH